MNTRCTHLGGCKFPPLCCKGKKMSCGAFGELLGQRRHGKNSLVAGPPWGSDRSQRLGKYQPNKPRTLPKGECQAPDQGQVPLLGPGAQQDVATQVQMKGEASPGSRGDGSRRGKAKAAETRTS